MGFEAEAAAFAEGNFNKALADTRPAIWHVFAHAAYWAMHRRALGMPAAHRPAPRVPFVKRRREENRREEKRGLKRGDQKRGLARDRDS